MTSEKRVIPALLAGSGPDRGNNPVNKCASFHDIARMLSDFWTDWSAFAEYDQLCLAVPDLVEPMSHWNQLCLGTGSLKLKNSPYIDRDFTKLVTGAEFIQPLFDYATDWGYTPCRPMIRYLPPKKCLSYHRDDVPVRFHLVLDTHPSAFFVVNDVVYRMPEVGSLYSLRTDQLHTAVNAHLTLPRIHFTFSGYKEQI